eukprot:970245-Pleurochrysis_carterae.AAC.3
MQVDRCACRSSNLPTCLFAYPTSLPTSRHASLQHPSAYSGTCATLSLLLAVAQDRFCSSPCPERDSETRESMRGSCVGERAWGAERA